MAFTGQGGVGQTITQTAGTTDANPSGLGALTGVTTRTLGFLTIYDLGGANLVVAGTLTVDPRTHQIINATNITVNGGGTLNAGVEFSSSYGGGVLYSKGTSFVFSGNFTNNGTFNQRGAEMNSTINSNAYHQFNGTVLMRDARWVTGVNANHRLRINTATIDIDGLETYGVQFDALMTPTASTVLKNIRPTNVGVGIENALAGGSGSSQVQTFDGVPSTIGKVSAFTSNWSGVNDVRLIACEAGSLEMIMPDATGNTGTSGHGGRIYQRYQLGAQTTAGVAIQGAIAYLKDTNNGKRKIKNIFGGAVINETADQVQINQTAASGLTPVITLLTSHIYRNNTVGDISAPDGNEIRDLRGKVNTAGSDLFDAYLLSYQHQITPVLDIPMKGLSTTFQTAKMLADSNVTLSQSAAAALTSIATLDNLYDAAKNWKCQATQTRLEYPTIGTQPVTATGAVLNLGSRNLVIDGTAASAFAINTGTNTITIKSNALAAGTKFTSLTTTGTITFANGATSTALYTSSSGTSGILNLSLPAGASVLVTAPGGTTTYTASTAATQTIYFAPGVTGAYTVKVAQRGFKPASQSVTVTGGGTFALAFTLTPDTADTLATPSTVTDSQSLYDAICAYRITQAGMAFDLSGVVKSFGAIDAGSFNLVQSSTATDVIGFASSTLTFKSDTLSADTFRTTGTFTQTGTPTLDNSVRIRASNFDSELVFSANSITLYPTAADRDAGTNPGPTSSTGIIRFRFGSTVSGVVLGGQEYARVNVGVILLSDFTLVSGTNTLDLGTSGQLAALSAKIDTKPTLAQIEASTVLAKEATVTAARTAIIAEVDAIPTNPLLTNDARLNNLDATVSSRLPTTSYVAPTSAPTAADNAAAVRTNLATELARIDVATSTRLAAASYVAPTVPPTAAQNATAVRTELATELARVDVAISTRATQTSVSAIPTNPLLATDTRLNNLDATVSSRLASSAYVAPTTPPTAVQIRQEIDANSTKLDVAVGTRLAASAYVAPTTPPTAAQNATAVRTELATELARIDVATSTRLATSGYTAPLTSAQTQSAAAAALVAYDAVVPADIAGLATSANVTAAQAVIVTEINANETKIDAVKTDTAAIKAKTDILVNTDLSAVATQASVNALGTPLQASNYVKPPTASEIAVQVEFAITNEGDGRAVLQAIADKIGNENVTATVIAQTVRTALATELARIDAPISSRSTLTVADIPATGLTPAQEASLEQIKDTTSATFGQVSKLTN